MNINGNLMFSIIDSDIENNESSDESSLNSLSPIINNSMGRRYNVPHRDINNLGTVTTPPRRHIINDENLDPNIEQIMPHQYASGEHGISPVPSSTTTNESFHISRSVPRLSTYFEDGRSSAASIGGVDYDQFSNLEPVPISAFSLRSSLTAAAFNNFVNLEGEVRRMREVRFDPNIPEDITSIDERVLTSSPPSRTASISGAVSSRLTESRMNRNISVSQLQRHQARSIERRMNHRMRQSRRLLNQGNAEVEEDLFANYEYEAPISLTEWTSPPPPPSYSSIINSPARSIGTRGFDPWRLRNLPSLQQFLDLENGFPTERVRFELRVLTERENRRVLQNSGPIIVTPVPGFLNGNGITSRRDRGNHRRGNRVERNYEFIDNFP